MDQRGRLTHHSVVLGVRGERTDTSLAAGGNTPVVGAQTAVFRALTAVPIVGKSPVAAAKTTGWMVTKDIGYHLTRIASSDRSTSST